MLRSSVVYVCTTFTDQVAVLIVSSKTLCDRRCSRLLIGFFHCLRTVRNSTLHFGTANQCELNASLKRA